MQDFRQKAVDGLKPGDSFTVVRKFSEQDMIRFADISKDYNPIHFDERFAAVKKFQNRICHGLLVGSMLTEIGGQIGWLASGINFKFRKPVYFEDTITCCFTITAIDEKGKAKAEIVWQNQDGVTVMESVLTGILPGVPEREVMMAMIAEGDPTNKLTPK